MTFDEWRNGLGHITPREAWDICYAEGRRQGHADARRVCHDVMDEVQRCERDCRDYIGASIVYDRIVALAKEQPDG